MNKLIPTIELHTKANHVAVRINPLASTYFKYTIHMPGFGNKFTNEGNIMNNKYGNA